MTYQFSDRAELRIKYCCKEMRRTIKLVQNWSVDCFYNEYQYISRTHGYLQSQIETNELWIDELDKIEPVKRKAIEAKFTKLLNQLKEMHFDFQVRLINL